MRKNSIIRWSAITAAAWILCVVGAAPIQADSCFSASLDAAIVLPGGETVDSGVLKICVTRALSPVSALHKTYVDGKPVAMLLSRRGFSEGSEDGRPFMMFSRDDHGNLRLYGFATPADGRMITYRLGAEQHPRDVVQIAMIDPNFDSAQSTKAEALSTILVSSVGPPNGR